jgi:hypothetical protein
LNTKPKYVASTTLTDPRWAFDRVFAALANPTRRDIVRRGISAEERVPELASHIR